MRILSGTSQARDVFTSCLGNWIALCRGLHSAQSCACESRLSPCFVPVVLLSKLLKFSPRIWMLGRESG